MFRFVGLCFGMLVRFFRERRSLLLGATRRAAPSLQSSGIVRIDFRPVLYICALLAHAGWPPPESSCSIEPITACLLHQEPPRLGSRLEFWRQGIQDAQVIRSSVQFRPMPTNSNLNSACLVPFLSGTLLRA